jgi:hypothetical protein
VNGQLNGTVLVFEKPTVLDHSFSGYCHVMALCRTQFFVKFGNVHYILHVTVALG